MSCVSTCHLPHGSDYKYELPFKNNMELCLSCHPDF
jgi:predicted CXXCH cytochrome family protein